MDKTIYERLFSTRAYSVISKAEELCETCKYGAITPTVLFVSMIILEKDYLEKVIAASGLDYGSVCKNVETELRSIPKRETDDYCFSDLANEIISKAILNKKYNVVTIMDLLQELSVSIEINELLDYIRLEVDLMANMPDLELKWDPETAEFVPFQDSYYDDQHQLSWDVMGGCFDPALIEKSII